MLNYDNTMKAIILFARPYSFTLKDSGEVLQGVKIDYYPKSSLFPVENLSNGKLESLGKQVMSDTLPYDSLSKLKKVPGIYDCAWDMKSVKSEGRDISKLTVIDIEFISPVAEASDSGSKK